MSIELQNKKIVEIKNDLVTIDWHLGNHCRHSCSYCPSRLHAGESERTHRIPSFSFLIIGS